MTDDRLSTIGASAVAETDWLVLLDSSCVEARVIVSRKFDTALREKLEFETSIFTVQVPTGSKGKT